MFTKIEEVFWKDEKMRPASDDVKLLMFYLLTSPHRNIIGFYFLPVLYISSDLNWKVERVSKGLGELFRMGRVMYDNTVSVVLIKNFLKYNPLENGNQVTGAIKKIEEIPRTALMADFKTVLKGLGKPLYKPLLEWLGKQVEVDIEVEVEEDIVYHPVLKTVKGYPLDVKLDTEMINRLNDRYPKIDIEAVIKEWAIAKLDNPLKPSEKPRSQINTWCSNAEKWGKNLKKTDDDYSGYV